MGVTDRVRDFYADLPFNYYGSAEAAAKSIRENAVLTYPDLHALLGSGGVRSVIDVGCGAGWFSNSVALHYGVDVTGVDMTARAIERARAVAAAVGVGDRARFVESDLFDFRPDGLVDLAASIGVLHHTRDCRAGFERVAGFVAPGGHLFVGLYHRYGRRPFLDMFREIVDEEGEEAALARYAKIHPAASEATHLRSWFRDQVLHPHETQHTLEEVLGWIDEAGFELLSTSINHFEPLVGRSELIELEKSYAALSVRRNREEGRYFPGFFTVLARRPGWTGARSGPDEG